MARLRIAGIGAGYFSRFHLEGWRNVAGAEVVAWCDAIEDKARAMAGEFGVPRTFADAAAMLDACQPDLVDIVTPPPSHAVLVALAHARGIPVICQKPMTPSWSESVAMADAAAKSGVLCVIHENFRFQPWYREAKRLLTTGALGVPHGVAFRLRPGDGQGPRAYLDRQPYFQQMSRLLIVETAIHWIDTFRFLLGEVEAITARLRRMNPVIAGEDAGILIFEFAGGETGLFDGNRLNDHVAANPRRTMGEMWLEGSGGVLRLDPPAGRVGRHRHLAPDALPALLHLVGELGLGVLLTGVFLGHVSVARADGLRTLDHVAGGAHVLLGKFFTGLRRQHCGQGKSGGGKNQ